MNHTSIAFDDLTTDERIVYLKAAQRLLDQTEMSAIYVKAAQRLLDQALLSKEAD